MGSLSKWAAGRQSRPAADPSPAEPAPRRAQPRRASTDRPPPAAFVTVEARPRRVARRPEAVPIDTCSIVRPDPDRDCYAELLATVPDLPIPMYAEEGVDATRLAGAPERAKRGYLSKAGETFEQHVGRRYGGRWRDDRVRVVGKGL